MTSAIMGAEGGQQTGGHLQPTCAMLGHDSSMYIGARTRDDLGSCAFDNPYFRDEPSQLLAGSTGYLRQQPAAAAAAAASAAQSGQLDNNQLDNNNHHRSGSADTSTDQAQMQTANLAASTEQLRKEPMAGDQMDFIEHHISNLHNKQVTSSVKELSILSPTAEVVTSPTYIGHVVDLTNEEQRTKVIADPKEGDLVAVDLIGHDFIGLGFDVCGNAHEGIFVRSVLTRGPARESGCIHPGDRIKCLNISFDNMTLQDACDILTCGSPYKLRLLVEKRALNPKLVAEKHRHPQPAPMSGRRLPRASNLLVQNQQLMAALAQAQAKPQPLAPAPGPFAATKSYIKRLAQLMAPSNNGGGGNTGSHHANTGNNRTLHSYRDQFGITTPPAFGTSDHQRLEAAQVAAYHALSVAGANGTRRASMGNSLFSLENSHVVPGSGQAHINPGYGSDGDETGDELSVSRLPNGRMARRLSRGGDSVGGSHNQLRGSRLFSETGVADMFSNNKDFAPYSSFGYQNRNANHRLHGPPLAADERLRHDANPLRLVDSHEDIGQDGSTRHKSNSNQLKDAHLEQTQSQPEIARSDTTNTISDLARDQLEDRSRAPLGTGRAQFTNSMSTPAMNLLLNSTQHNQDLTSADQKASSSRLKGSTSSDRQKNTVLEDSGNNENSTVLN